MIEKIRITRNGVEYSFDDDAPDNAREQLADAGDPTDPTKAKAVLDQS